MGARTQPSDGGDGSDTLAERWLAYLYVAAGVLALLNGFLAGEPSYDSTGLLVIALAAWAGAVLLLRARGRTPAFALHAGVAAGTAGIGAGIHFTAGVPNAASMLYLWVVLYAFYFFARRAALGHVAVVGISYAVPIALRPPEFSPVAHWATTVGAMALAGWFVGVLKGRLDDSLSRLELLADTDALTGLANRRGWTGRALAEISRAVRARQPLCVALVDLDNFKAYNDRHGHAGGDRLLTSCADAWRGALREMDFLARIGGDEFAMLLPGCDTGTALRIAERLRAAVPPGGECSIGIAEWSFGDSIQQTLAVADAALYEAKRGAGRGIVMSSARRPLSA